jgi:hypothetical protein
VNGERADEAVVAYDNFEPDEEGLREALTSTGTSRGPRSSACHP